MNVTLFGQSAGTVNFTNMTVSVTWSGSVDEVARKADITYINAPYDPIVRDLPKPVLGDYFSLIENGTEIFFGRVYGIEKTSENGTVTANCIDDSNFLLKTHGKYSFEKKTAGAIAAQVLSDFEFPVGSLAGGAEIKSMIVNGESVYDIIKNAYDQSSKLDGNKYTIRMEGRALVVEPKGSAVATLELAEDSNIIKSSYQESTDSIVNRVVIYDKDGNRKGTVEDGGSIGQYGVFQQIYEEEEGLNPETAAENMLSEPDQSMNISALGNISCVSGCAINLRDSATGIYGTYWVKNDSHKFEHGNHTMDLEISFKEVG